jgi:hypothetical protein
VVGLPSSAFRHQRAIVWCDHHAVQPSCGAQLADAHAADAHEANAHAANLPTANVQASGAGHNQPPFGRPVPSGADSWPRFTEIRVRGSWQVSRPACIPEAASL